MKKLFALMLCMAVLGAVLPSASARADTDINFVTAGTSGTF